MCLCREFFACTLAEWNNTQAEGKANRYIYKHRCQAAIKAPTSYKNISDRLY